MHKYFIFEMNAIQDEKDICDQHINAIQMLVLQPSTSCIVWDEEKSIKLPSLGMNLL